MIWIISPKVFVEVVTKMLKNKSTHFHNNKEAIKN